MMMICYETVNSALESSIFLCNGNKDSRGTPCKVWLEAMNEMAMQEKGDISEMQRVVGPVVHEVYGQPPLSHRPGVFAMLGQ